MDNILIAFVTLSDPETARGFAQTLTAARALEPSVVHLLYTEHTEGNCASTIAAMRGYPALANADFVQHRLGVADARDLTTALSGLRAAIPAIRRHRRGLFHLVSGHPAMRLAMELCVAVGDIDGVVHSIDDPLDRDDTSRMSCQNRMRDLDINIIREFLRDNYQKQANARLHISVAGQRVTLDGRTLGLRSRQSGEGGMPRSAACEILAALAARRKFGRGDAALSVDQLSQAAYGSRSEAPNVWKRIEALNEAAARVTKKSPSPIAEMIVPVPERSGFHELSPLLEEADIVFAESEGDLLDHLKALGIGETRLLFPRL